MVFLQYIQYRILLLITDFRRTNRFLATFTIDHIVYHMVIQTSESFKIEKDILQYMIKFITPNIIVFNLHFKLLTKFKHCIKQK